MSYKEDHNIFIGSDLGTVKGLKVNVKDGVWSAVTKSLLSASSITNKQSVTSMAWGDDEQKSVLIGFMDQTVKVYDADDKQFITNTKLNVGEGPIYGISRFGETLVVAVESGHIQFVTSKGEQKDSFCIGKPLEKMRHNPSNKNLIAVGGKNNDLQLWDLEHKECTFKAKNVRNDYLELQVPVWITDIDFMSNSSKIAVCSKYGHVRIYDPCSSQRRPVFNFHIPQQALTACSASPCDTKVVVGSGTGHLCAVDIRGKGLLGRQFKGSVGSVKSVVCHPSEDLVVSAGLDRYIKIHSLSSAKLLYKEYMKTKLRCVLVRRDFFYEESKVDSEILDSESAIIEDEESQHRYVKPLRSLKEKRGYDRIFAQMENIVSCPKKKKMKRKVNAGVAKLKKDF